MSIVSASSAVFELNMNLGRASALGFLDAFLLWARLGEEGGLDAMKAGGGCRAGEMDTEAMLGRRGSAGRE